MARVLVTGASGFIGGHLVEKLVRRGDQVKCLVRPTSNVSALRGTDVEVITAALEDVAKLRRALRGVDIVYHLAGLTNATRIEELYRVNRDLTYQLSAACAAQTTPPISVHVSSIAAAGPAGASRPRRESDPPAPVSYYGISKRAGELVAQHFAESVPTTIVRPGIVFGPQNRELLPAFQAIAKARLHLVATWNPPPLSLIYVDDLVELLFRAATDGQRVSPCSEDFVSGYYFACDTQYPTYLQLGRMIANALGIRHIVLLPLADPLPWLVATASEVIGRMTGRLNPLTIDKIREATSTSWACDPHAAWRDLQIAPSASLQKRLQQTARWYTEHGWLKRLGDPPVASVQLPTAKAGHLDVA